MQQKRNRIRLNRYTAGTLVFLVVVVVTAVIVFVKYSKTAAAPKPKITQPASIPSEFKFTGTTGWWQGATSKSDIAIFPNAHNCFVSVQHKMGTVAADQAKFKKSEAGLTSSGYTIARGLAQTLTIQTNTGPKQYILQQSSVTTPTGASNIEGGQEFGYLQLTKNDYLYVEGYCDTSDELPATIPVLKAIRFDETK